jgi:2'-5' RNA ligase
MEVKSPWPDGFPFGRLLDEQHRHMTLAFLGNVDESKLRQALVSFPKPEFKVGFAAKFDQCLFLPPHHPHVVAWHIEWLEKGAQAIMQYYQVLVEWLQNQGFSPATHAQFIPHVTIARRPFNEKVWRKKFSPLPAMVQHIHLYESMGNLKYQPIWTHTLLPPFLELEHTADIAYDIYGHTFDQLYHHAALALCFNFTSFLLFLEPRQGLTSLEDVIVGLNQLVSRADQEIGCPFKAVSFHSHLEQQANLLKWEMIIDV